MKGSAASRTSCLVWPFAKPSPSFFDVDNALATALIDRLMHHGEALVIQGDSYRMRDKDSDPPSA